MYPNFKIFLSRNLIVSTIVLVLLLSYIYFSSLATPIESNFVKEIARSTNSFIDSIGVNVHLNYTDTVYGKYKKIIKPKLIELGVRHIRDGIGWEDQEYYHNRLKDLATFKIRSTLIHGYGSKKALSIAKKLDNAIEAVEGPNEVDIKKDRNKKLEKLRDYMQQLHDTYKSDPVTSSLPIIAPTFLGYQKPGSKFPDLSAIVDYDNIHPYTDHKPEDGNLDTQVHEWPGSLLGKKPIIATETGYQTGNSKSDRPVSEIVQSKYLPRFFLEAFNVGVVRTFAYELIDLWAKPSKRDANFGILRNDGSPKPAFTAIKNLITILNDSGSSFKTTSLEYSINGNTKDLHHTLLQKRNGDFYLILWLGVNSSDQAVKKSITLNLPTLISEVTTYLPNNSINETKKYKKITKLKLDVPDYPLVVKLVTTKTI